MDYTVHGILQARILEWVAIKMHLTPCFKRLQRLYSEINLGVLPEHNCCHFSWAGPSCLSTQATLTRIEHAGDHWHLSFSESQALDNWISPAHSLKISIMVVRAFPVGASNKEPACQCRDIRDAGSTPGLGRSPGGKHGNPLQYSCLGNPLDRRAWWATVHRVTKSQTQL